MVIDQDLDEIKRQLSLGTSTSYTFAERLYKEGTQSRATAVIALDRPLDRAMAKGSIIHGLASTVPGFPEPQHVFGQLHDAAESGDTTLWIAYDSNTVEKSDIHCQDDVNPTSYCNSFLTSTGNINFPALNVSYAYSYNMTTDNIKDRTIQGLSTNADKWMRKCQKCPRRHFRKFRRFYGRGECGIFIDSCSLPSATLLHKAWPSVQPIMLTRL